MKHSNNLIANTIACAALALLPTCSHKSNLEKRNLHLHYPLEKNTTPKNDSNTAQTYAPPITIWIHGTKLVRRTTFHTVFNSQTMLKRATELNHNHKLYRRVHAIAHSNPYKFPIDTFYVFGWNGKLRAYEREQAAEKLYTDLQRVITQYKKQHNAYPSIRIITHSHAGNVVLNLAKVKDPHDTELQITSLIMLACPVQEETMDFINNAMFKRVYALYSSLDVVQIMAPQVIRRTIIDQQGNKKRQKYRIPRFSARCFPPHSHLMQTKIKVNDHAIFHTGFISTNFLEILPRVIAELDSWYLEDKNVCDSNKDKLLCVYKHHKHHYH